MSLENTSSCNVILLFIPIFIFSYITTHLEPSSVMHAAYWMQVQMVKEQKNPMPRQWCEQGCFLRDVELGDKGDPVPRWLATACRPSLWPQSSLTVPDQASHKSGQCPVEGVELGGKQMESGKRLEPGILEQNTRAGIKGTGTGWSVVLSNSWAIIREGKS